MSSENLTLCGNRMMRTPRNNRSPVRVTLQRHDDADAIQVYVDGSLAARHEIIPRWRHRQPLLDQLTRELGKANARYVLREAKGLWGRSGSFDADYCSTRDFYVAVDAGALSYLRYLATQPT